MEKKEGEYHGVNVIKDINCKTVPTLVQILAMRCYASDGVVHARNVYRFKAHRIHVTHGLCDAERPDKAPHGLILKYNVHGNRPESESDKLGPVDQQATIPDHLQPVSIVLPAGVGRNRGVAQHNHCVGDAEDLDTAEGVR